MKKNLLYVLGANIINIIIGIINSFFLPKYLSLETYGMIKTYQFYISYVGCLHLGYIDGMYLKYGGVEIHNIDCADLDRNIKTLVIFQVIVSTIFFFTGIRQADFILTAFSLTIFTTNFISYLQMLYQAVGDFKLYSSALNSTTIFMLVINVLLLIFNVQDYRWYVVSYTLIYFIVSLLLWTLLSKRIKIGYKLGFSFSEFQSGIKTGFVLMLGNLSSVFLTGLDRWFVKFLLGLNQFSFYTFAVSLENFIILFTSPVTTILYNYFCKNREISDVKKIKNSLIILSSILIALAFPIKWVILHYIDKYYEACNIIFLLFASQVFYICIKGIYINLYKAMQIQKTYVTQLLITMIVGFLLNTFMYALLKNKEAMAIATLLTSIIWLFLCEKKHPTYQFSIKEYTNIFIILISFLLCGMLKSPIIGFIIYIFIVAIIILLGFRDTLNYIILIMMNSNK